MKFEKINFLYTIFLDNMNVFNHLEPVKYLAKGSYGKVVLVINRKKNEVMAIKIMNKKHRTEERAIMEKNILQYLTFSPNIIHNIFAFESIANYFICTKFYQGGTLSDCFNRKTQFTQPAIKYACSGVLSGLTFLHERFICHGDIKLANVLIDRNGSIVLGDFGCASLLDNGTGAPRLAGTLDYMSPEIINLTNYSLMVDVWSAGILMAMLLSGMNPFDPIKHKLPEEIANKDENDKLKYCITTLEPVIMVSNTNARLKQLCLSALKKNPNDRITAKQMLNSPALILHPAEQDKAMDLFTPKFQSEIDTCCFPDSLSIDIGDRFTFFEQETPINISCNFNFNITHNSENSAEILKDMCNKYESKMNEMITNHQQQISCMMNKIEKRDEIIKNLCANLTYPKAVNTPNFFNTPESSMHEFHPTDHMFAKHF